MYQKTYTTCNLLTRVRKYNFSCWSDLLKSLGIEVIKQKGSEFLIIYLKAVTGKRILLRVFDSSSRTFSNQESIFTS